MILKIKSYITYLLKSWKFITICGFLLAFILFAVKFSTTPLYRADLNFMLSSQDGAGLGGITSLLGQFGLPGGSSESNLDKVIELSRARVITEKALFSPTTFNEKNDLLANHLIEELERKKLWYTSRLKFLRKDSLNLKGFRFTNNNVPEFSLLENKALKYLHGFLVHESKGVFTSEYSELSGIMKFSITTPHPELSIISVNKLFDNLSEFYLNNANKKQEKDYNIIKSKYDSIENALESTMYAIAKFEDENRGLITNRDALKLKRLKGEELKLGQMYSEIEKQFQLATISRERSSEYIQVIDRPLLPLRPINKGRIFYFLLGGLLGGILSILYLVSKKTYSDIMSGE